MSGILAAAAADDARLGRSFGAPLIALLFGTGLRLGEALALPWGAEGLDLHAGVVRVRRSLDRVRDGQTETFPFVAPKTRTSRRDVPVRPRDVAAQKHHRLASGRPRDGELVFADERGRALTPNGRPRHAFIRAVRAAELGDPTPKLHDLRHAYATALLAARLTVHAVAELLGHSSPALVMGPLRPRLRRREGRVRDGAGTVLRRLLVARPGANLGPIRGQSGDRRRFATTRVRRWRAQKTPQMRGLPAQLLSSAYGI